MSIQGDPIVEKLAAFERYIEKSDSKSDTFCSHLRILVNLTEFCWRCVPHIKSRAQEVKPSGHILNF